MVWKLSDGYEIREMSKEDFRPLFQPLAKKIFGQGTQTFQVQDTITRRDEPKVAKLKANLGKPPCFVMACFLNQICWLAHRLANRWRCCLLHAKQCRP